MDQITIWLMLCWFLSVMSESTVNLNKGVIVHLFEWKFADIAVECEEFLSPHGFAGIQISPASENLVIQGRPWFERYQPVSYKLSTRSGTVKELGDMITRCNKVGIRVFVDVILNHMTSNKDNCQGTATSSCDTKEFSYPAVPYMKEHFNQPLCQIKDYFNITEVRVCELISLHDLNQTQEYVRQKQIDHLNELIDLGVTGFRLDAAKHMFPNDIWAIIRHLHNLNTSHGFPAGTKALVYQEVTRFGAVTPEMYTGVAMVCEFAYGLEVSRSFQGRKDLSSMYNIGPARDMLPDNKAIVFVENHDGERDLEVDLLTYKRSRAYKMAISFMLAWPYGTPKILSSFYFSDINDGPPQGTDGQILTQQPIIGNICSNSWVCQHRWRQIANMVSFHNVVEGTEMENWWDNSRNQIAFCRGKKGFIAFNMEPNLDLNLTMQTCLPAGNYCDIISGTVSGVQCTGKTVAVYNDGTANIFISKFHPDYQDDGVLALHIDAQVNAFSSVDWHSLTVTIQLTALLLTVITR